MKRFIGKTMFVLGAGASYHTGAPLLFNFMSEARARMMKADIINKSHFKAVFEWIEKMRAPAYYLNLDLNNLEHVFSLISMFKAVDPEKGSELFDSISFVMLETLEQCQIKFDKARYLPDPVYGDFIANLEEHKRELEDRRIIKQTGLDTIVTFNYDVMLDFAYYHKVKMPNYCLKDDGSPHVYKLLKLHGSMNWATCKECCKNGNKNEIQVIDPTPVAKGYEIIDPDVDGVADFRMLTHTLLNTRCDFCNESEVLYPVFIPPTWTKNPEQIKNVWKTAVDELHSISQIVIIGYSLPPTDTFFQYILALGLFENSQLERIIVIDPAVSEDFKERYENAFSRGIVERGQLKFKKTTFKNLVSMGGPLMKFLVYDLDYDDWD